LDENSPATVDGRDGSDHLHGLDLRSSASAAKKKNDRIDANKIADCLRCDFLPACYMASSEIRARRRTLRYRNLLVRQAAMQAGSLGDMPQMMRVFPQLNYEHTYRGMTSGADIEFRYRIAVSATRVLATTQEVRGSSAIAAQSAFYRGYALFASNRPRV